MKIECPELLQIREMNQVCIRDTSVGEIDDLKLGKRLDVLKGDTAASVNTSYLNNATKKVIAKEPTRPRR